MKRSLIITAIQKLQSGAAGFRPNAVSLAEQIGNPTGDDLIEFLLECGVIPETFTHDSSEEKLYAKYCDILLMLAFNAMGIASQVIETRADSADVEGKTRTYTIVGDAKAFRLSRTAKNQKDFKVGALSGWRGLKDFACLVCPLYHYPSRRSQIYQQAIDLNVALLGYVHIAFLVKHCAGRKHDLRDLWGIGASMKATGNAAKWQGALAYWSAVDQLVCQVTGQKPQELAQVKALEKEALEAVKKDEIAHLIAVSKNLNKLSQADAVVQLRKALKLEEKIRKISRVSYWKSEG